MCSGLSSFEVAPSPKSHSIVNSSPWGSSAKPVNCTVSGAKPDVGDAEAKTWGAVIGSTSIPVLKTWISFTPTPNPSCGVANRRTRSVVTRGNATSLRFGSGSAELRWPQMFTQSVPSWYWSRYSLGSR